VVLEGIPADIAGDITRALSIPTIGIGAGPDCDGQILVLHDLLGLRDGHVAKFVKQYAVIREIAMEGMKAYIGEVEAGVFPSSKHSY